MKRRHKTSLFEDVYKQPVSDASRYKLYNSTKNSLSLVQRMSLMKSLDVHQGCVNSICWNETGDLILSGSDDQHIVVTNGYTHGVVADFKTSHRANIFSAKFLPAGNDNRIVSCAGDGIILFTDLNRLPETSRNVFNCHSGTTYEVITIPDDPHSFLSCGEDGTARWFDLRQKNKCTRPMCKEDILVSCPRAVTTLAINAMAPYQLAIGCSDSRVRLFDRRMLGTKQTDMTSGRETLKPVCVFTAPKLEGRSYRITSLSFSPDGEELLASVSSDHLYLFNIRDQTSTRLSADDATPAAAPAASVAGKAPASPPVRRLRLRGDWSDTGPDARPESEGGRTRDNTSELTSQPRATLHATLMQRMTDVLSRMLNDPATRAALNGAADTAISPEDRRALNLPGVMAPTLDPNLEPSTSSSSLQPETSSNLAPKQPGEVPSSSEHNTPLGMSPNLFPSANTRPNTVVYNDLASVPTILPHCTSAGESSPRSQANDGSCVSPFIETGDSGLTSSVPASSSDDCGAAQLTSNDSGVATNGPGPSQLESNDRGASTLTCNNCKLATNDCGTSLTTSNDPGASQLKASDPRPSQLKSNDPEVATNDCDTPLIASSDPGASQLESNDPGLSHIESNDSGASQLESNDPGSSHIESNDPGSSSMNADDFIQLENERESDIRARAQASWQLGIRLLRNSRANINGHESLASGRASTRGTAETLDAPRLAETNPRSPPPANQSRAGPSQTATTEEREPLYNIAIEMSGETANGYGSDGQSSEEEDEELNLLPRRYLSNLNRRTAKLSSEALVDDRNCSLQPSVKQTFVGHRNARTMIKEACFWGTDYVMSGSDCGHVFVWDRSTARLVCLMPGDKHVVNCLQPHPTLPVLATSGIDYDVKLWAPLAEGAEFDEAYADNLMKRNEVMLEETKDTITVPASFMIRVLACLNQIRRGGRVRGRRTDPDEEQ